MNFSNSSRKKIIASVRGDEDLLHESGNDSQALLSRGSVGSPPEVPQRTGRKKGSSENLCCKKKKHTFGPAGAIFEEH